MNSQPLINLGNAIIHWARYTPGLSAIRSNGHDRSYQQIGAIAATVGALLKNQAPSQPVAVATPDDGLAIACWAGALISGNPFVPLREVFTAEQTISVLDRLQVTHVLVDDASSVNIGELERRGISVLSLPEIVTSAASFVSYVNAATPVRTFDHQDIACTLLTSGTTGIPDLVPKTLYTLQSELLQWIIELRLTRRTRIAVGIPSYHTGGFVTACSQLMAGGSVVFVPFLRGAELVDQLASFQPTTTFLTNHQYRDILASEQYTSGALRSWETVLALGEHLPKQLLRQLMQDNSLEIIVSWGNTEGLGTVNVVTDPIEVSRGLGRPFICDEIAIVNNSGIRQPPGNLGRIAGKSDNCLAIELETSPSEPDLVISDDIGEIDLGGYLSYAAREGSAVYASGRHIPITELEDLLRDCEGVSDIALAPVNSRLFALAVSSKDHSSQEVSSGLVRAELTSLGIDLAGIEWVSEVPTTSSGKVDRLSILEASGRGEAGAG